MMYNYPLFSTVTVAPNFSNSRFSISAPCSDMPSFTMQGAVSHIYLAALRSCVTRSLRHLHTCSAPAPRLTSLTLYPPGVFIASISSEQSTSFGCFSLLPNKQQGNRRSSRVGVIVFFRSFHDKYTCLVEQPHGEGDEGEGEDVRGGGDDGSHDEQCHDDVSAVAFHQ